jgi:hypothetical protein
MTRFFIRAALLALFWLTVFLGLVFIKVEDAKAQKRVQALKWFSKEDDGLIQGIG